MQSNSEVTKENIDDAQKLLDDTESGVGTAGLAGESHLLIRGLSPGEDLVR